MDLMIDIETLATGPDAMIMTIAAQAFDPLSTGWPDRHFYARVTPESNQIVRQTTTPLNGGHTKFLKHKKKYLKK